MGKTTVKETYPCTAPDSPSTCTADRRLEPRYAQRGPVQFEVMSCFAGYYRGELVEISAHGMRITHECFPLERGMRIRFCHALGAGVARVIWNRRSEQGVESGLQVEG